MPDRQPPGYGSRFTTTRWSLVLAAGQTDHPRAATALAVLCETYWYPVYAFIRRQGYRHEDSADLAQAFFTRVLEKGDLRTADPARGRFRAFLCASLKHFLSNERDRARTLKRGGGQPQLSLDASLAEGRYRLEPQDDLTPERLFDRRWALLVLERVLNRLQAEHAAPGKALVFSHLKGYLTGDGARPPYAQVATALAMSEGAVKVAVHRLRRRFRDVLVEEIAETVSDTAEVDDEIRYLLKAISE